MVNEPISPSPPLVSISDSPPGRQVDYTFNSKVMVAAMVILFVVVVFVVSLHVYAKWFWRHGTVATRWSTTNALNASWHRRRRRLDLVTDESMAINACIGLDPSAINSLPYFVYDGAMQEAEPLLECAVCLSEFQAQDKGRILPNCKHSFHVDCIDMWFHSHSTCPLCRTPVLSSTTHEQHAGNQANLPAHLLQHALSSTMQQPHADAQDTPAVQAISPLNSLLPNAGASLDRCEPLPLQSIAGLELHSRQERLANDVGMAATSSTHIPPASVLCPYIPSYGEFSRKEDIASHAGLHRMGASGSSSARVMPTEILRQQERAAIARSTSLSSSRQLSGDVQECSPRPQKSLSFRISIKRLVSRELSKGRSRVFPSGQANAEAEQSTGNMISPV